jgi:hypothetical protein
MKIAVMESIRLEEILQIRRETEWEMDIEQAEFDFYKQPSVFETLSSWKVYSNHRLLYAIEYLF